VATLEDPGPRELFEKPYHAVISTLNADGSIHSTIIWADLEDGKVAVNSAVGRLWPTNLQRDPHATVLVYDPGDPYHFVEARGRATTATTEGADEHIDRLAKKYLNADSYPNRRADEQRIKFLIEPDHVRYVSPAP
jgi:PPOX class probable F420-dependent enzyme